MKKHMKKYLAFGLVAITLAGTFVACGNQAEPPEPTPPIEAVVEPAEQIPTLSEDDAIKLANNYIASQNMKGNLVERLGLRREEGSATNAVWELRYQMDDGVLYQISIHAETGAIQSFEANDASVALKNARDAEQQATARREAERAATIRRENERREAERRENERREAERREAARRATTNPPAPTPAPPPVTSTSITQEEAVRIANDYLASNDMRGTFEANLGTARGAWYTVWQFRYRLDDGSQWHINVDTTGIIRWFEANPPATAPPAPVTSTNITQFVGTITDLEVHPAGGNLRLLINEDDSYEIVVHFGSFTQLHLDTNDLLTGDRISVFTDGTSNTSDHTLHVQAREIRWTATKHS